MKSFSFVRTTLILLSSLLLFSCSATNVLDKVYPTLQDGKYDSEFPYRNSSAQLEEVSNTIKLINTIAFYTSYVFPDDSKIYRRDLTKIEFEKTAAREVFFNRTASGTATVVEAGLGSVVLLTVSHVVSFPDTVVSYFVNPDGSASNYVQSISIKTRETHYVPDLPDNGEFEIIVHDPSLDIALLGHHFRAAEFNNLSEFSYPWGNSSELEWGSFVYVFGFPMNYKMITKGIVSKSSKDKNTFLIDAGFDKGSSGGIVLAVRDGVPNFELVGLVRSVPAEYEFTLKPFAKENEMDFNPMIPYKGEAYVDKAQIFKTGIIKVIAVETVKNFLASHEKEIYDKGYSLRKLFSNPTRLIKSHIE
jgi:hypothetical protein